ncbi:MAG: exodeoxyribonuclease VII small subunit [Chloroflexia bacterium]
MSTAPKENLSYEEAYLRLEEAVAELSAGGLSLEAAIARFEQGMALANYCSTMLDRAELRVQQVGQLVPEDLDALLDGGQRTDAPEPPSYLEQHGPLTGPAPAGRRGLPDTTGSVRKRTQDPPLDPLFDDI